MLSPTTIERSAVFSQTGPSTSDPLATSSASGAELAEDQYFDALVAGDVERIEELLTKEFLIVDVMSGGVVDRPSFIAALRDGLVAFERVHLVERVTRRYGDTAIIVGRTDMSGSFDGARFAAASRYTHVLLRERDGRWRLASAQGTRIDAPLGRAVFVAASNPNALASWEEYARGATGAAQHPGRYRRRLPERA